MQLGFEGLPNDIVLEILVRVSVNCLMRLRCTSKTLYKLLTTLWTDPRFMESHLSHATKNPGYLVASYDRWYGLINENRIYYVEEVACNLETTRIHGELGYGVERLASSGGLIAYYKTRERNFYVCNPVIGEHIRVPPYANRKHDYVWGFGYSLSTKEYKIVKFGYEGDYRSLSFYGAIYTLGSNYWKEISHVPNIPIGVHVDCKGTLFWLINRTLPIFHDGGTLQTFHDEGTIMSFDIDDEKFHVWNGVPTLILGDDVKFMPYLINVHDTIAYVLGGPNLYEIWVLKDKENDIWTKEYNIVHPRIPDRFRFFAPYISKYEKLNFLFYGDETEDKRMDVKFSRPIIGVPHIASLVSPLSIVNMVKKFSICEII
ncbi:F-box domain-containing protein/FBA_3 domain-containing protein [Cephalotus follicularis]|uniref:F-box domain-containing protein/FBA_3 domain-containing protein n=1 Tax=Cephalotus follicularis TaxID=3775 RepID=A0A1Q3B0T5_CEPFO|nr:F-box domain-containing protein/FBA_3 domain-containing protein [Cephalotus follicularis]